MNGLGNDFVIIDMRAEPFRLSEGAARAIADRENGIGCDQLILLEPSSHADTFMRIVNADGSEAGACGNATRCVATLMTPRSGGEIVIETAGDRLLRARCNSDGLVTVDMGAPRFAAADIPLSRDAADTSALDFSHRLPDGRILEGPSVVNVGNPHCIFWVDDAEGYDLAGFGPVLEHDPLFPERANISLAEVISPHALKLRVWERGAGLTRACGTAACAAAVAAARSGRTGREVEVALPGGVLHIAWRQSDDHILMTGPAALEFTGILHLDPQTSSLNYERFPAALSA
jgi:diaminopimelate epimerase